jgi:fibronectin type 3 domain-containing protein/regulation of enolase protein 1 (concanavalin A-like superfamily)
VTGTSYNDILAPAGQTSFYRVTAVDQNGLESAPGTTSAFRPEGSGAPNPPSNLVATPLSQTTINLTWNDNSSDETGFKIQRSTNGGGFVTIFTTGAGATNYTDASAQAGNTYTYQIVATNASGDSAPSNAQSVTTTTPAPAAPSNLVASQGPSGISLTWSDNSNNETGFVIERKLGAGGTYAVLTTTAAGATSFLDTSVTPGQTYFYRVSATNAGGNSSPSNESSAVAPQPSSFASGDIGNPTPAGSTTTIADGVDYDVAAGGTNIWDTSDQFRFVYKQYSGDFDVKVQIIGVNEPAAVNALVGLMARESLAANSANVFMRTYGQNGGTFKLGVRSTTGGTTTSNSGVGNGSYPNVWVRLARVGNTFTGYYSANGVNWTVVSTANVAMSANVFVGMAVTSRSTSNLATAQFRSFGNTSGVVNPPADPTNLHAMVISQTEVDLMWDDNSDDETGFRVERATGNGPFVPLATVGAGITGYSDTSVVANTTYTYRVFAINGSVDSTNPAVASPVTTPNNPSITVTSVDIGNPSPAGGLTVVTPDKDYDSSGAGANVWDTSDQFHFDYIQVTGDFDFRARIAGVTEAAGVNALVGLMARETLAANSKNVYARTYGQSGGTYKLGSRSTTGGTTTSNAGIGANSYPNSWIRLARVGDTFTGYFSTDGVSWTVISSATVSMSSTIYLGFAVASRAAGQLATAQFRDVSLTQ